MLSVVDFETQECTAGELRHNDGNFLGLSFLLHHEN